MGISQGPPLISEGLGTCYPRTPCNGDAGCSLTQGICPASPGAECLGAAGPGAGSSAGRERGARRAHISLQRRRISRAGRSRGSGPSLGCELPLSPCILQPLAPCPAPPHALPRCRRRWKRSFKATKRHPVFPCRERSGLDVSLPRPRGKHLAPFLLFPQGNGIVCLVQW